ncbi:TetR family transcriptional regulator [Prauserella shujinwangii]|uniref:TetR family transcriptional regulator n=1 Tax=Prauserella shujinwangii TaxID=1453103 RepID=A0A2T0LQ70_9PSEU|nr:TetR family transcriptional regulator [Prauserella shujinwangii]PRX45474.1 TetR family transcriptional regulator [Prauserella shujinwangii]
MNGTTLRADARRNRERVLQAAREAFAAEGFAVPLDDIARRAGVGAGTVYRHFPSKEALFDAVVAERAAELTAEARAPADSAAAGAAFFAFVERVVAEGTRNAALRDALTGPAAFERGAVAESGFAAALGELLRRAQAAGAVRGDVDLGGLRALIAGCLTAERTAPAGRHLTSVFLDGLRAGS